MAAGDVYSGLASLGAGASLDIRPAAGQEAVIHNLYYEGAVSLRWVDGTLVIAFDSDGSAGAKLGLVIHVANARWLQIVNTSAGAFDVGWDGIFTK